MSATELGRLYAAGRTPQVARVRGDFRGKVLATPALGGFSSLTGVLTPAELSIWKGKSFEPTSAKEGRGHNRLVGQIEFGNFRFYVGPSRAGSFKALQLDYGQPGNPWPISAIRDEIREIAPGLLLGQAYLQVGASEKLLFYWALEAAPS